MEILDPNHLPGNTVFFMKDDKIIESTIRSVVVTLTEDGSTLFSYYVHGVRSHFQTKILYNTRDELIATL